MMFNSKQCCASLESFILALHLSGFDIFSVFDHSILPDGVDVYLREVRRESRVRSTIIV
jgi:hypothetical protein